MSLCVYKFIILLVTALLSRRVACVPCKGTIVCASQICDAFKFLIYSLLHLIRRSHRDASHLFFATCVERSAPAVFFLAVKAYNLEHAH